MLPGNGDVCSGASRKRGRLQWVSNMRSLPWVKGFGVWGRSTADRVASASFHTCVTGTLPVGSAPHRGSLRAQGSPLALAPKHLDDSSDPLPVVTHLLFRLREDWMGPLPSPSCSLHAHWCPQHTLRSAPSLGASAWAPR